MFSKVITRGNTLSQLTGVSARSFRATAAANNTKKPSIGDAVTILQSKVSGINQVVSFTPEFGFHIHSRRSREQKDRAVKLSYLQTVILRE